MTVAADLDRLRKDIHSVDKFNEFFEKELGEAVCYELTPEKMLVVFRDHDPIECQISLALADREKRAVAPIDTPAKYMFLLHQSFGVHILTCVQHALKVIEEGHSTKAH